ncbi:MAG TPA: Wzz/FepE/Etk N-terminal domain-containing protein [Acidimicrobiales bacterium]|jgi:uncharacterized protein involved in exopolysaccharide biosynthesis|nr:Wzz/FepE/Etk N-terminal domain-containing protein [Acidimicrobiales bacterium]
MEQVKSEIGDPPTTAEKHWVGTLTSENGGHRGVPQPAAQTAERSGITEYARVLWDRKWIIIVVFVLGVGGVLTYCVAAGKTYTAQATVLLEPPVSTLFTSQTANNATAALVNVQDVIQVMESSSVSNIVARTIPNPPSVSVAQVGTLATTDVVTVSASSSSPQTAAAAANAYANGYINFERGIDKSVFNSAANQVSNKLSLVQLSISNLDNTIRSTPTGVSQTASEVQLGDLENQQTSLENQLQQYQFAATQGTDTEVGRVISAATAPSKPSSPHTIEYVIFAVIFSLIFGIGLALLVNAVSPRRV